MKNFFLAAVLLCAGLSYSQENLSSSLGAFEAINSNIGATIHIVKSDAHKIHISGNSDAAQHVLHHVRNNQLKIRSNRDSEDYDEIVVTIYTPVISVLEMSNGGSATLDEKFSRMESFEVSATDGATIDLTNIEFKSLVAQSSSGGQVLYRSASKLIKKAEDGGKVRSIQ